MTSESGTSETTPIALYRRSGMQSWCRRNADKTPHHGPPRLRTVEHGGRVEPWTVQHFRERCSTRSHACRVFPKPGVAGSIPAGGTKSGCIWRFRFGPLGPFPSESARLPTFCRRVTVRLGCAARRDESGLVGAGRSERVSAEVAPSPPPQPGQMAACACRRRA